MIGPMMTIMAAKPVALLMQVAQNFPNDMTPEQKFEIAREALQHGQGQAGILTQILVPLALFAMVGLIVWFVSRRKQAQIQAHAETRKLLIEKFGSAQELATFLESKGGQQFIGGMQMQARNQLRFLPGGVIMTMLGLAFLGLTLMRKNFLVPAVIFLAIGIGLLISAAIAHKLARNENGPTIESGPSAQPLPHA